MKEFHDWKQLERIAELQEDNEAKDLHIYTLQERLKLCTGSQQ